MRTDPSSFQGLQEDGLPILRWLHQEGFHLVVEVTDPRQIPELAPWVSIFQVGARNMYNYELLKELALWGRPVLLKRALSATVQEWIKAAQYLLPKTSVILCERGIRTFETSTRFTLDLGGAWVARQLSGLPVIIDPSHSAGRRDLVIPLAKAALAAGFDGLLVEVHPEPDKALSDGPQSLDFEQFDQLWFQIQKLSAVVKAPLTGDWSAQGPASQTAGANHAEP